MRDKVFAERKKILSKALRKTAAIIATVLAIVAATGVAAAQLASGVTPPGTVLGSECPDVMVLAARGSGEQPQPGGQWGSWNQPAAYTHSETSFGVGEFNFATYQNMVNASPRLRFGLNPVRYSADPAPEALSNYKVFEASASAGAYSITTEINQARAKCGTGIRFALLGYSQGAWSVHKALWGMTTPILNQILAVVTYGDPEFYPGQSINRGDQAGLSLEGLGAIPEPSYRNVPTSIRPRTAVFCLQHDPICQAASLTSGLASSGTVDLASCQLNNWQPGKCAHTSYAVNGIVGAGSAFAANLMPVPAAPAPAVNRTAITSYDQMRGGAPHNGYFNVAWQPFTAASNTLTWVSATVGSSGATAGLPVPGRALTLRVCTESSCVHVLAQTAPTIVNYGETGADIGDIGVAPGTTYYLVWNQPPAVNGATWNTYWWGGGSTIGTSDVMQATVRGYNR